MSANLTLTARKLLRELPRRIYHGGAPVTFEEARILAEHDDAQVKEIMRLREIICKGCKDHALRDELRRLSHQITPSPGGESDAINRAMRAGYALAAREAAQAGCHLRRFDLAHRDALISGEMQRILEDVK